MMVTAEFWQQLPIQGPDGRILHLPGHSTVRWQVAAVLYNFWEIMGRGFFALLVYFALLVSFTASPGRARPNDPCPCGSGRKFKRCCARQAAR
jgi:hypothetical protein